jgi:hypothetical protein
MKRDLYAEVSTRIVAELERGATPSGVKPGLCIFYLAASQLIVGTILL